MQARRGPEEEHTLAGGLDDRGRTEKEKYPGDRVVEVRSRDSCSDWVRAWMDYPVTDYQFAYTWFPRGEWDAGNRRSICWAKTTD